MIICLSGWKQSGKDTTADYLINKYKAIRIALADPLKDSVAEEFGIERSSLDDPKRKELPLKNMPVEPKDDYSRMIAKFMIKEFRSFSGKIPTSFDINCNQGVFFKGTQYDLSFKGEITDSAYTEDVYWTPRALAILKGSTNRSTRSDFWTNKAFEVMEAELKENPLQMIVVTDVRYKSELAQFKERFGNKVVFVRINRFDNSPSNDPSERDLDSERFDWAIDNRGSLEELHSQLNSMVTYFEDMQK